MKKVMIIYMLIFAIFFVSCDNESNDSNEGSNKYTIMAVVAGTGGSISPSGSVSVEEGDSQNFTIMPYSYYDISSVVVDGIDVGAVASYTFHDIYSDHTIVAHFSYTLYTQNYTINVFAATGGNISPSGIVSVKEGDDQTFTITPDSGYTISTVWVDSEYVGTASTYTFYNVDSNHTISAFFSSISSEYYTINASAGTGGSISPSGSVSVEECNDQTFTITPSSGYTISSVLVDGFDIGSVPSYTFNDIYADHTINVIFETVDSPILSVLPTSLDFSSSETSTFFNIGNTGTGSLTWNISEDVSWITSITPVSGTDSGTITVQVSRSGLSPGSYSGEILITSNAGNQNIGVSLTVVQKNWAGYAEEDSFVDSYFPDENFGTEPRLFVSYDTDGTNSSTSRSFIYFDFADDIPADSFIISAELRLCHNSTWGVPFDIRIGWVNDSWLEGSIIWDSQPSFSYFSSSYFTVSSTTSGYAYFDITDEVQRMVNNDNKNGFAIRLASENGSKGIRFYSTENTTSSYYDPYLTIQYIEPDN